MKLLTYTFFTSMVLLSESYRVSSVVSASKAQDTSSEQDTPTALFLNEQVADNTFSPASSNSYPATLGGDAPNQEGSSRIIIVADSGLWRGPKMPSRSLPFLHHWDLGAAAAPGDVLAIERRDTKEDAASKVPIGRRDTMRCMVGRVYRPCWEV